MPRGRRGGRAPARRARLAGAQRLDLRRVECSAENSSLARRAAGRGGTTARASSPEARGCGRSRARRCGGGFEPAVFGTLFTRGATWWRRARRRDEGIVEAVARGGSPKSGSACRTLQAAVREAGKIVCEEQGGDGALLARGSGGGAGVHVERSGEEGCGWAWVVRVRWPGPRGN